MAKEILAHIKFRFPPVKRTRRHLSALRSGRVA